ncbi:oxygenase MpaB family protein [Leifsonia sp. A12D58]|uniref:oxygenase MpaB family protein n=1 Tax=Leifsonia sp. A12D58 TaxID=3397674 RepID=UPI0039E129BC
MGFLLAYYRSFGVPRISDVLVGSGEVTGRPKKRASDTGIVIYEIIANGIESERGEQMVELLRRVHRSVPGTGDDFLYILISLLVLPVRWTMAHGWRPLEQAEVRAAHRFYQELGQRMGLTNIPPTYEAAAEFFDRYESANVRPAPANQTLMAAAAQLTAVRLPALLRPLVPAILSGLVDDRRFCDAVGLPTPNRAITTLVGAAVRLRAIRASQRPLPVTARFVPGAAGSSSSYPRGYALSEIGPESANTESNGE